MKENLKTILQSLRSEQAGLEKEKQNLYEQSRVLNQDRQNAARTCVLKLLPDLSPDTASAIRRDVPGFNIPMVSKWLGLSKKIDPNVSTDTLRIQLGTHLDNTTIVPEVWRKSVGPFDRKIRDLQKGGILANENRIAEIKRRIQAIERLSGVNLRKMDPKIQRKLERALSAQAKSARPFVRSTQVDSDSGPSLLEMWLWYQLLTPGSETSHEIDHFSGGGGGSIGAGAGGGWLEGGSAPASTVTDTSNIDTQIALGAGSFS